MPASHRAMVNGFDSRYGAGVPGTNYVIVTTDCRESRLERMTIIALIALALTLGCLGGFGLLSAAPHQEYAIDRSTATLATDAAASLVLFNQLEQEEMAQPVQ